MAIVQGIGYPNSSRSHFRGMDIWHTCEPDKISTEGWIAKLVRELDPGSENPLTAVSFGRGLPRACAAPGVTVTSVGDLDAYGLMTSIEREQEREENLDLFRRMYTPAVGAGLVRDYLGQTGRDVLAGADVLAEVPGQYSTTVEWGTNPIATALRDVSRVHTAGLGTRVFYTQHAGYDYHSHQPGNHDRLLNELCGALSDFLTDLRNHEAADNVAVLVFTEFGRRIKDNGSGTDHGSGGGAYILGERVAGRALRRVPVGEAEGLAERRGPEAHDRLPRHLRHDAGAVDGHRGGADRGRRLRAGPSVRDGGGLRVSAWRKRMRCCGAGFPYLRTVGMRRVTSYPTDLALGDDDVLFVVCRTEVAASVRRLSQDDEDLGTIGSFLWPQCIVRGPEGHFHVSDEGRHTVTALTAEGEVVRTWGEQGSAPGQLDRPSGLAFDGEGNLLVADTGNHRIQRFTPEGRHLGGWGSHGSEPGQFDMPWGLTIDEEGDVFVADWRNDRVQKLTAEGEPLLVIGSSGSGDGEFNRPSGRRRR